MKRHKAKQLDLPGLGDRRPMRPPRKLPAPAGMPAGVRFGTFGWCYPSWGEEVWSRPRTVEQLDRDGLPEYQAHPLFSLVYLAATGPQPLCEKRLRRYGAQLVEDAACIIEVHETITEPRFTHANHPRPLAGRANPDFLSSSRFVRDILEPTETALGAAASLYLFRFSSLLRSNGLAPGDLSQRLARFFSALPAGLPLAVELDDASYLTLGHARLLARFGAAHVFSTAPGMPTFAEQQRRVPSAAELVIALNHPLGVQYPSLAQREAAVIERLQSGPELARFVLVGEGAHGAAPQTIARIASGLAHRAA